MQHSSAVSLLLIVVHLFATMAFLPGVSAETEIGRLTFLTTVVRSPPHKLPQWEWERDQTIELRKGHLKYRLKTNQSVPVPPLLPLTAPSTAHCHSPPPSLEMGENEQLRWRRTRKRKPAQAWTRVLVVLLYVPLLLTTFFILWSVTSSWAMQLSIFTAMNLPMLTPLVTPTTSDHRNYWRTSPLERMRRYVFF